MHSHKKPKPETQEGIQGGFPLRIMHPDSGIAVQGGQTNLFLISTCLYENGYVIHIYIHTHMHLTCVVIVVVFLFCVYLCVHLHLHVNACVHVYVYVCFILHC